MRPISFLKGLFAVAVSGSLLLISNLNGAYLTSASGRAIGFAEMKVVERFPHQGYLQGLAWSLDGTKLVTLSGFGSAITIWDTSNGKKLTEISQYGAAYSGNSIAWTKDGLVLSSVGSKSPKDSIFSVGLWDAATGSRIKNIPGPPIPEGDRRPNQAEYFVLSKSGSLLAMRLFRSPSQIIIFNTSDWSILQIIQMPAPPSGEIGSPTALAFSLDERSLAVMNVRHLQMVDIKDGTIKRSVLAYEHAGSIVRSLKYSPDGRFLATAPNLFDATKETGPVRIWDSSTFELIARLPGPQTSVRMIDWNVDGTELAVAGADKSLRVWRLDKSTAKLVFDFGNASAGVVAFSSDGRLAAGDKTSALIFK